MRPRLSFRDLLGEAVGGLLARPGRVALTVLGTVIGIAALVATLGLSKTASNQIQGRFDAVAATDVVVSPARRRAKTVSSVLPFRAEARLQRLNGVVAAGSLADVRGVDALRARQDRRELEKEKQFREVNAELLRRVKR